MNIQVCRTVTLHDVLWACETYWLTVREEHELRQFNAEEEVWRKLRREERSGILDQTSDQVRENEIGRACDTFGGYQRCMEGLARKSGRKRPLGRRIVDRRLLQWIFMSWVWGMDWIDLAQDRDKYMFF
jgi:hypothetical protein